ncbi:CAP domain-containing protein [Streptosporangium sp. NPDC049376]|uniref:CAP domain-containing protein n=1 Tax=Streptosporangium sp. NPDC049376 TaxID=3366192 RepID=UPI00378D682A
MRRPLGILACAGGLVARGAPSATAQSAEAVTAPQVRQAECRVYAAAPAVSSAGKIQASAIRVGCTGSALVRIRIMQERTGTDPTVRSASLRGVNGRVTVTAPCVSGVYYAVVTDDQGNTGRSKNAALSCGVPKAVQEVLRLTNAERRAGGCPALRDDSRLRSAAQGHSADMAANNYFNHTSKDGRTMTDRIKASGFSPLSAWAENMAWGQRTPAEVVKAWMNSPGHRRNIMTCSYTHIGIGVATSPRGRVYWTQDFARH